LPVASDEISYSPVSTKFSVERAEESNLDIYPPHSLPKKTFIEKNKLGRLPKGKIFDSYFHRFRRHRHLQSYSTAFGFVQVELRKNAPDETKLNAK